MAKPDLNLLGVQAELAGGGDGPHLSDDPVGRVGGHQGICVNALQ